MRDAGHSTEIGPFGDRPDAKELSIDDVSRVVSELRSDKLTDRLIAIRSVRRAPLRFVAAIALGYKSDTGMAHVSFLVDGRPLEHHAAEFVRSGGMKRPMFRKFVTADEEAEQLRAKVKRRLTRAAGGAPASVGKLTLHGDELADTSRPVTPKIYALPSIFRDALTGAKERLIITSRGISSRTVNPHFLASIESLLEQGVSVFIGLGPKVRAVAAGGARLEVPLEKLHALQGKSPNLKIVSINDLSCTHLIVDKTVAVVGDYDWLSPDGSSHPTFSDRWFFAVNNNRAIDKEAHRFELPSS